MPLGKNSRGDTVGPSSAQRSVNAKAAAAKGPLRKVVDDGEGLMPDRPFVDADLLECGHVLRGATDLIGRRFPERRRCYKCGQGRPKDVS